MYANTQKSGNHIITLPDVCKTPTPAGPIPIPYPNQGFNSDGKKYCNKVLYCKSPAHNTGTYLKSTSLDELGKIGGIVSNSTRGKSEYQTGVRKVLTKKQPTANLLSLTTQNSMNTVGSQKKPSQSKVLILG